MGRKNRDLAYLKPFCFYCDKTFKNEVYLHQHQKAKHFTCQRCQKKFSSCDSLKNHAESAHHETLSKIPNALQDRNDIKNKIFGMQGVPRVEIEKRIKKGADEYWSKILQAQFTRNKKEMKIRQKQLKDGQGKNKEGKQAQKKEDVNNFIKFSKWKMKFQVTNTKQSQPNPQASISISIHCINEQLQKIKIIVLLVFQLAMDLEEVSQLINTEVKQKKKIVHYTKRHPLETTCNSLITLMFAILTFLIILLVLDTSGYIKLKELKTFQNKNIQSSFNLTDQETSEKIISPRIDVTEDQLDTTINQNDIVAETIIDKPSSQTIDSEK